MDSMDPADYINASYIDVGSLNKYLMDFESLNFMTGIHSLSAVHTDPRPSCEHCE